MWRHVASNALTFFIVALFLIAGLVTWANNQYSAVGPLEQAICLRVDSGSNMRAVSEDLAAAAAISSGAIFRLGADYSDKSQALKAGSFLVPGEASMEEIVDLVTGSGQSTCGNRVTLRISVGSARVDILEFDASSQSFEQSASFPVEEEAYPEAYETVRADVATEYSVVVSEGVTSWQVIQSLNAFQVLAGDMSVIPDEGSLAPNAYEVSPGAEIEPLIAQMQELQVAIMNELWAARADGLPVNTPEEALVLASIVEKETGQVEERPQVASVFVNRLRQGMRLQTDPTVIYGVTNGQGVLGRGLRQSELRGRTPYNTYVIEGLPPGPIANPGRAAIEATLHPADTDFIFFVADGTGGHAFATNLDDHNTNVAAWRAIEAQ